MGKDTPSVSLKEQYTQSDIPQHVQVHVRFQMIQNARAENTLSQKDGERFIILQSKLSLFFSRHQFSDIEIFWKEEDWNLISSRELEQV